MRHILSVLVENEPGVLSRVAGLFSGRGFNVGPTLEDGISHMTITTFGDDQIIEQIIKQLRKLVTVVKVVDLTPLKAVQREIVLVKVRADDGHRADILRVADIFRCKSVDVSDEDLTFEITGNPDKIKAFMTLMQRYGVLDMARSGTVAMRRSMQIKD
jgi:acetolactate synthase-1/3 small subunit